MNTRLLQLWKSRTRRERVIIILLPGVLAAVLYAWLLQSAQRVREPLRSSVATLRSQASGLEQQAKEYQRLRAAPPITGSATDLRTLVEAQAGASGLSRAVVRLDAADAHQVQITFGAVRFADWLAWLAALQSQQIRVESCRIEALAMSGMVSVTATLVRARPK